MATTSLLRLLNGNMELMDRSRVIIGAGSVVWPLTRAPWPASDAIFVATVAAVAAVDDAASATAAAAD